MKTIDWQKQIDDYLETNREEREEEPLNVFHPSSLSGGCLRQATLSKLGLKKYSVDVLAHFELGKMIHSWIEDKVADGLGLDIEREIFFGDGQVIFKGRADAFDNENKVLYDFKTSANAELSASKGANGYEFQLHPYMKALGAKKAVLVWIDKRSLKVSHTALDYSEKTYGEVLDLCEEIMKACVQYRATGELPKKDSCFQCNRGEGG